MSEKLKDYQVIDVFCGGTFYKVRHKVTSNIFAWKAYDCSAYSEEQIQNVVDEVKTISTVISSNLLRYYDTILHAPSKTLYFVLEYNSWRSVEELIKECKAADKHIAEGFIWHLLLELARVCKALEPVSVRVLQKCISTASIFVSDSGEVRVNCFELTRGPKSPDLMRQLGDVAHTVCYRPGLSDDKIKEFCYSDDLRDVISFLTDNRESGLRPDVVLYHPTVLANLETQLGPKCLSEILLPAEYTHTTSEVNKCDSEKVVDLCRTVEPLPRTIFNVVESPIYCNISPRKPASIQYADSPTSNGSLSPTLAALALELPGYVPRCRKPYTDVVDQYNCPQRVSEDTLSQQWMSRLIALRQREESLNKRERDLIAKEIVNSPSTKIIPINDSQEFVSSEHSNGITLPQMITQAQDERRECAPRRRHRRASSVRSRGRRKSYGYEDLDSSLSADAGDGSMIITAAKFTQENMPRRNIFPDVSTKKVHFTSSNPFVESDESVTLTFYELDNLNVSNKHQQEQHNVAKDIAKFKYLNLEKLATEKRSARGWSHSSPSKQAKITKSIFGDITNSIRKTPSKSSISSQCTNSSRYSVMSRSEWSVDYSKVSEGSVSDRTRASMRLAQTPTAPPDKKGKARKSLLNFKTPFKFRASRN
ncbi:uncharacterized protein LOC115450584 [Manduca sexta]|uniref:uncharacterized protein LOC115450584 n=1 Tax=Manduca sexta TaxID=7130 RepID=UPI0011827D73|nr:uncharacterized protein LOC115450584 [Manduca sexta]